MAIITAVNFESHFTSALILSSHRVNAGLWDAPQLVNLKEQQLDIFCASNELYAVSIATANTARRKKIKVKYARKDKQDFVETQLQNDKTSLTMH